MFSQSGVCVSSSLLQPMFANTVTKNCSSRKTNIQSVTSQPVWKGKYFLKAVILNIISHLEQGLFKSSQLQ